MEAVKAGTDYDLINPHTKEACGKLNAKEVFDKIVDMAWRTGDPGIVFIDRINQDNPTPQAGQNRKHQSLRRAAAAPLRVLQPGFY